jgi:hypothetical protein
VYEIVKELNRFEKNTLCLHPVHENDWLRYLKTLWESTDDRGIKSIDSIDYIGGIIKGELQDVELNQDYYGWKDN